MRRPQIRQSLVGLLLIHAICTGCVPASMPPASGPPVTSTPVSTAPLLATPIITPTLSLAPAAQPTATQFPPATATTLPAPATVQTGTTESLVLNDIDQLVALGNKAPASLWQAIQDAAQKDGSGVAAVVLPRLADPAQSEQGLAMCAAVLGETHDLSAVDALGKLATETKSALVKQNCLRALAMIGGQKAGDYIASVLRDTSSESERYVILDLLAGLQCDAILPFTVEVLQQDPQQYYWKSFFVFGKLGDKGVPFLVGKLDDQNRNVRFNAVGLLSQWLLAPEAFTPLRDRFWKEKDPEIRRLIFNSFQYDADLDQVTSFVEQVAHEEKDEALAEMARQSLDSLSQIWQEIDSARKQKNISAQDFKSEYEKLYQSAGNTGDYQVLSKASSFGDEQALKKLRERILQRQSDEAFYDYRTVNSIILLNRFLEQKP